MPSAVETRDACPIVRTHQRFLLRSLEFTQQYAPMYRCRLEAQYTPAIRAIQHIVTQHAANGVSSAGLLDPRRVLELQPGVPAICVGVVYKNMKMLPRFLDEYQRELVRIDAGDEDNDDDGGGAVESVPLDAKDAVSGMMNEEGELSNGGQALAAENEQYSVCNSADELMLEDSSGRVLLQGLNPERFCTGVVLGIYGNLLANGSIAVIRYAFAGDLRSSYVPRSLAHITDSAIEPCYIAFVSGLSINLPRDGSREEHAAVAKARASLELLVDFLCGGTSNAALRTKAKHVTRLVIGGDSIAPTDELKLKKKVKLDPSDHVRMNDDKAQAGIVTSAALMRELDVVLERVVSSVEVEMMPGDNDMSDAFQPQQPLHPVLLPKAARHSTLRLVSNPFCFTALPPACAWKSGAEEGSDKKKHRSEVSDGVNVFVTSGQNINDVARESRFPTRLDTMSLVIESGCACPTAPNTLFSYPFCKRDPFLFERTPHCMVACDQPRFETRFATLEKMYAETHHSYAGAEAAKEAGKQKTESANEETETEGAGAGVRLICVPSFARSGALVLMDVNSPTLETTAVNFTVP
ncbi:putative DNA polymerase delta subunit 2 [Leptomonas pyrrhocoris]|uniref:Putative DNA polymerase delta subunit 2 n=1 Tax=Leptomonas pyrrhocoris TaxID=157538 RepID=A0A0N0DUY2_LEPPY|nr:putative DNA polymerase delta subunit 2 [Leptomonas pyrrhocoris]KPA79612.1 putative DNA polymerase delta subunit 2 [Leptomonas pyrrhocoris]|eukprot:XP_015658051.1 putative DNA polymerase delta subunit 2 [Leptomonas pyrrhocoris]